MRTSARERIRHPSGPGLLIVVLVALKLAGVIRWPWWEVLLPVWFGLAALFLAASYALTAMTIDRLAARRADRAERRALKAPPHHPSAPPAP